MFTSKFFPVVCIAFATAVTCNSVGISVGASINLIALGTVDGKTFFADNTQRNWTAARTYCSGMGMRLAEITSKAQWDLLASAHNTTTFQQDHWTAARDSHTSRQFTWDGSLSEPSKTFGEWRNTHGMVYETCASFFPTSEPSGEMHFSFCSLELNVLCETLSRTRK